jgi:hypothetical protein
MHRFVPLLMALYCENLLAIFIGGNTPIKIDSQTAIQYLFINDNYKYGLFL